MQGTLASLDTLLAPIRAAAMNAYVKEVSLLRDHGHSVKTEEVMRDDGGEVVRLNVLNLPSRVDARIVGRSMDDAIAFDAGWPIDSNPRTGIHEGQVDIDVEPFTWTAVSIRYELSGGLKEMQRLRNWYLEWFQHRVLPDYPQLSGAVHSMTGPVRGTRNWVINVDLGTAPVQALRELLEALLVSGARQIEVSSARKRVVLGEI